MTLVEKVLKGIDDTRPIYQHADRSVALKAFLKSYEEQTLLDSTLPALTPTTCGRELKDAFGMLEIDVQIRMLNSYWGTLHGKVFESPAVADERRQRHWMVKFAAVSSVVFLLLITGGVLAIAQKQGDLPDSAVMNSILKHAGEILKVIIGAPSK